MTTPLVRRLPASTRQALWRRTAPPLGDLLRWSDRRVGIALMHHRIGERPGDPDTELVPALDVASFERQLRRLKSRYRVVPASRLLEAVATRRRGERIPVAITFDDDLPSHRRMAAPALRRHGLTATFFLTGASLDRPFRFWWERLQDAVDRGLDIEGALKTAMVVPDRDSAGSRWIHALSAAIRALEPAEREGVFERLSQLVGPDPEDSGLRADDVRWLVDAGFEIGFHTRHHPYLPSLDDRGLQQAMVDGRDRLADVAGQPLDSISYPHGGTDARVASAARASGFRVGFTVEARAATPATDALLIGRVDPLFHSNGTFAADLAWRLLKT